MRSFLSFLTVAIGVAALLYTFAMTEGQNQRMKRAMELTGPGRLVISAKRDYQSQGLSTGLTYDDARAIREAYPGLFMVSPEQQAWAGRFQVDGFEDKRFQFIGVTPEWAKRDWVYELRGRFLRWEDVSHAARVCVLIEPGGWLKKPAWLKFFGMDNPFTIWMKRHDILGKTMVISGETYFVAGILQEPPREKDPRWYGRGRGFYLGGRGIIPITTFFKFVGNRQGRVVDNLGKIDEISVDTGQEKTLALYERRLRSLLLARHRGEEDFEIRAYAEMYAEQMAEQKKAALAIMVMGAVCVLAGGIGIMNVTLATIYSRIREIGIRRAVGASRRDILLQFVIEAMLLGFLGGLAGVGLGVAGINWFLKGVRWMEIATFEWHHFALALLISIGTGFIFSVYPAWIAAKLDPVEALRYE
ncbi:MAG: ABC transporter permease [Elusimicrobia bacterium]|nr:ABC transporter permease [Elusimicrobiota bacterium]